MFIEITEVDGNVETLVLLNVDHIEEVREYKGTCFIWTTVGTQYQVKESRKEMWAKLMCGYIE